MIGLFYHLDLRFLLIHALIVTSPPKKCRLALSRKRVSSKAKRIALNIRHCLLFLRNESQYDVGNVLVNFLSSHLCKVQQLMYDVLLQPQALKAICLSENFETLQGFYQDIDVSLTEKCNKGVFEHFSRYVQSAFSNLLRKLSKEGYFLLPPTTAYAPYELRMCFKLCIHVLTCQLVKLQFQYAIWNNLSYILSFLIAFISLGSLFREEEKYD